MPGKDPTLIDDRFARIRGILPSFEGMGSGACREALANEGIPNGEIHGDTREAGRLQAAVSLVLRARDDVEILLIRRAEAEGDPWSGHIALPGGRRESSDPDLLHTSVRETEEEVALDLMGDGMPLGCLDPLRTTNPLLPPLFISPFVFAVTREAEAQVASPEVEEVFWTSLTSFSAPEANGTVVVPIRGEDRTFPCFRVQGRVVWGLTYRILTDFFRRLDPPPTPR